MEKKQKLVSFGQIDLQNKPLPELASDTVLLLPTIDLVLFPGVTVTIQLTRPESLKTVEYAYENNLPIGVFCQRDSNEGFPSSLKDIYRTGVVAQILHIIEFEEGVKTALVRACSSQILQAKAFLKKGINGLPAVRFDKKEQTHNDPLNTLGTVVSQLRESTVRFLKETTDGPSELSMNLENADDSEVIVNMIATHFPIASDIKIEMLKNSSLGLRAEKMLGYVMQGMEAQSVIAEIQQKAREALGNQHRNSILQAQYDALRNELYGNEDDELTELAQKGEACGMTETARKVFDRELKKLSRFNPQSPDYAVLYTFLDTLTELPWALESPLNNDFGKAEEILEADHYGMKEVKERILQHLALSMRNGQQHAPVICLVGAPGVGKTSVGKSIARALGREYQRISLGGIHDESEIRGHRRTYIGAMPGRIIAAMLSAKVNNPVLLLDEIDKLGSDFKGDPNAALLEVMDPAQHSHFHDNYIDVDFDLSNVFFIATANSLENMPKPLLDRMEIIEMPGYLPEEKLQIARRHLIPSIRKNHGLEEGEFDVTDNAILKVIRNYTAESGVRTLEKRLAELSRKLILKKMRDKSYDVNVVDAAMVGELLGVEKFADSDIDIVTPAGVATGLAWTPVGGDVLYIESSLSPSKGEKLTLTGNLGNVMKESAMLATQYVKAHAAELGIDASKLENSELHIHVPEGAIPKDGPSAGITITSAIVSLLKGAAIKPGIAMTGEMTLRGKVLPVGGIKEKILAAKRYGMTDIYMSQRNRRDIDAIESHLLEGLTFHYVDTFADLAEIFEAN